MGSEDMCASSKEKQEQMARDAASKGVDIGDGTAKDTNNLETAHELVTSCCVE